LAVSAVVVAFAVLANAAGLDLPWYAFVSKDFEMNPYDRQVAEQIRKLQSGSDKVRAGAAEALGYLRAYGAADVLGRALADDSAIVRREAALSFGWCGGRTAVEPLLNALEDRDWVVRQAGWVALTNITGMEWPFDALAKASTRDNQLKRWRKWWAAVPAGVPPPDVIELLNSSDLEAHLRAVRALGSLGGETASRTITKVIAPYRTMNYRELSPLEKNIVLAGLRGLAHLKNPAALKVLLDFLDTVGWARYAADALGEFGSVEAVAPLVAAYPKFAKDLNRRLAELFPRDDLAKLGWNPEDRMYETPYAIILALSRLPWDDSIDPDTASRLCMLVLANIPSDWDGGMLYEPEAFELVTAYLLERAGLRQAACDAAFRAAGEPLSFWVEGKYDAPPVETVTTEQALTVLTKGIYQDVPFFAQWFPALCREPQDVPRLIALLEHENGWIRINAAKALMFMGEKRAVEPVARILAESKPEATYGFSGVLEHAEYNDPTPRWREAFARALGRLGAQKHVGLLIDILEDPRNVIDVQYAAALALDEMGSPEALAALKRADAEHPFHTVRLVAREALWRRDLQQKQRPTQEVRTVVSHEPPANAQEPRDFVFVKGENKMRTDFNLQSGLDPWRQTYTVTNSGPTMRAGRNLYILRSSGSDPKVTRLTYFTHGFVAACEVSWDARQVIFARRLNDEYRHHSKVRYQKTSLRDPNKPAFGGDDDPWWHLWQINIDGTGLKQITFGPYHDVQPAYLPDGRIVFSSTRIGMRDEYHGFPCTGLTVMNADGSDIHCIGFNLGGDREPAVSDDGRIVFSRLDLFYSRLKTEFTVQAVFPDGTGNVTVYGPERRDFWYDLSRKSNIKGWSESPPRHRVLRLTQPQPFDKSRLICSSSAGLTIVGPGRHEEHIIPHDKSMAVTCPFPLDDGRILCAATVKEFKTDGRIVRVGTRQFGTLDDDVELEDAVNVDLGLYILDADTGRLTLLYNDPETADFEARPIIPRGRPAVLTEGANTRKDPYTAKLFCNSARISQETPVRTRGKLVRVIEGMPIVSRHETQQNYNGHHWRNHGGAHARVLGTTPLAGDGSFLVEVPADRLIHIQILDSDREVVGNQLIWMFVRPDQTRSCVGCHERRDNTTLPSHFAQAAKVPPVKMLPTGGEFSYRAKAWLKGTLPDEAERRTRVVRAVNLIGRY
jgi:HEAT repeat protein